MSPIRSGAKLKRGETVGPRWKFAVGQAEKGCLRERGKNENSRACLRGLVREDIFSNRVGSRFGGRKREREREVKNETRCVGDVSEREFLKF